MYSHCFAEVLAVKIPAFSSRSGSPCICNSIFFFPICISTSSLKNHTHTRLTTMAILNRFGNIRSYASISSKHYPSITPPYHRLIKRLRDGRQQLIPSGQRDRLTLAEKIFISHLDDSQLRDGTTSHLIRGSSFVKLKPDRVAMQGM